MSTIRNGGKQRVFVGPGPASKRAEMGDAAQGFILHTEQDKFKDGSPAHVQKLSAAQRKVLEANAPLQSLIKSSSYRLEFTG